MSLYTDSSCSPPLLSPSQRSPLHYVWPTTLLLADPPRPCTHSPKERGGSFPLVSQVFYDLQRGAVGEIKWAGLPTLTPRSHSLQPFSTRCTAGSSSPLIPQSETPKGKRASTSIRIWGHPIRDTHTHTPPRLANSSVSHLSTALGHTHNRARAARLYNTHTPHMHP